MEFANLFGKASKLASEVHRSLPPERRNYQLFRKMTGLANQMLKDGIDEISLAEALRKMAWNSKKRLPVKDKKKQAINGEERSPKKLDIAEIGQPQAVLNHSVGVLRYKPTGIPCDNAPRLKKNVGVIDPMQQCAVGSGLFRYTLTRQLQTEYCLILLP
ncbi:MAG: hypothetical protein J7578_05030 [Chitinophagaceae bacterium]|nr:hypothetical protein [Chitinophagaceae bacterium]